FVIFLQRNRAAPVASENGPGPETEAKSAEAQARGGNKYGIGLGNDVEVERARETVAAEYEITAERAREQVAQAPGATLVVDGALREQRRQHPDNEKNAPASADDTSSERI